MRFWFSPFSLEANLQEQLTSQGLQHDESARRPPAELLVLYEPPHALALPANSAITVDQLSAWYRQLIKLVRSGATAIAIPRLRTSAPGALRDWLQGEESALECPPPAAPSRMAALLTLTLLELRPTVLEAYLDLELHANLLGGRIDDQYLSNLRQVIAAAQPNDLLQDWHAPVLAASQTARRMHELQKTVSQRDDHIAKLERLCQTTSLTLAEERQKQERTQARLEQCRTDNADQQKKLVALQAERDTLRSTVDRHARQAAILREETQAMAGQIREAHVELEHTFLTCQRGLDLGRQCQVELQRAQTLLRRLP